MQQKVLKKVKKIVQVKKSVKKCVIYRNMNRKSAKNRFQKSNKKERRPKKVLKKVPKKE